jgi:hypothetical protein
MPTAPIDSVPRKSASPSRKIATPPPSAISPVHPEDHAEHYGDLEQPLEVRLLDEDVGELGDREDEDQIEEQLERGDPAGPELALLGGAHRAIIAIRGFSSHSEPHANDEEEAEWPVPTRSRT